MNKLVARGISFLIVLSLFLVVPRFALAQSATTGTIAGDVKDASGALLPGVTVEASSPALIEKVRTGLTNDEGKYRITDLRPGTYTMTFTLTGFATVVRDGVELPGNTTSGRLTPLRRQAYFARPYRQRCRSEWLGISAGFPAARGAVRCGARRN